MYRSGNKRYSKRRLLPKRVDTLLLTIAVVLLLALFDQFAPLGNGDDWQQDERTYPLAGDTEEHEESLAVPETKAGAPVRFMMYNVQNYFVKGERQRSRFTLTPKKEESRNIVADTIAAVRPEIVGLVEIGGPQALEDLATRLSARGLEYPHRKVLTREGEDRALALLSQHPIVRDASKAEYGLLGTQRRKMLRGILDITVQVKDGRLFRILGAHLKSHVGESEASTTALRSQEARTLAFYIRRIAGLEPNMPLLVYGDWNDGPAANSMKVLTQGISKASALRRLQPVDTNGDAWTHYYREGGEYLIYDRIYINAVLSSRMGRKSNSGVEKSNPGGSDHRAVWCEMR